MSLSLFPDDGATLRPGDEDLGKGGDEDDWCLLEPDDAPVALSSTSSLDQQPPVPSGVDVAGDSLQHMVEKAARLLPGEQAKFSARSRKLLSNDRVCLTNQRLLVIAGSGCRDNLRSVSLSQITACSASKRAVVCTMTQGPEHHITVVTPRVAGFFAWHINAHVTAAARHTATAHTREHGAPATPLGMPQQAPVCREIISTEQT